MDVSGMSAPECFRIDDLLDFSNGELFSASTDSSLHHHILSSNNTSAGGHSNATNPNKSADFTDDLCVPSDDVAELEWLSNFVDDSFTDFPVNEFTGIFNGRPDPSFHGRSRSKRTRSAASTNNRWASAQVSNNPVAGKSKPNTAFTNGKKNETSSSTSSGLTGDRSSPSSSENSQVKARRCTHCASEKTPQWRAGPLGPKTLCNACGVRYKSGRLVPEYRPAASPTFVLTQHSNSHRKVMELRRQKESLRQGQQEEEEEEEQHNHQQQQLFFHQGRHRNFEVC